MPAGVPASKLIRESNSSIPGSFCLRYPRIDSASWTPCPLKAVTLLASPESPLRNDEATALYRDGLALYRIAEPGRAIPRAAEPSYFALTVDTFLYCFWRADRRDASASSNALVSASVLANLETASFISSLTVLADLYTAAVLSRRARKFASYSLEPLFVSLLIMLAVVSNACLSSDLLLRSTPERTMS